VKNINYNKAVLLISVVIAFLLRMLFIDSQSLWIDEVATYDQISKESILAVYKTIMVNEGHIGPLYHIVIHLFSLIFGTAEWALRLPSAIFGTISVYLIFLITKETFGNKSASIASVFFALSPIHIWYSQEARMYSLWIMLILLHVTIFLWTFKKSSLLRWVILTIVSALSVWTLINSLFIFFAIGIYLIILSKKHFKELIIYSLSTIIAVASYTPGFIAFFQKSKISVGSTRVTSIFDLVYAFITFNVGTTLGPSLVEIRSTLKIYGANAANHLISQYGALLIPAMLLFTCLFLFSLYMIKKDIDQKKLLIIILLFIPLFTIFMVAFISPTLPFNVRYILCTLPFYIIILTYGISTISKRFSKIAIPILLIPIFLSLFNYYFNSNYSKLNFRKLIKHLNEKMNTGDKALIVSEYSSRQILYYDTENEKYKYNLHTHDKTAPVLQRLNFPEKLFYVKTMRTQQYKQSVINTIELAFDEKYKKKQIYKEIPNITIFTYSAKTDN